MESLRFLQSSPKQARCRRLRLTAPSTRRQPMHTADINATRACPVAPNKTQVRPISYHTAGDEKLPKKHVSFQTPMKDYSAEKPSNNDC